MNTIKKTIILGIIITASFSVMGCTKLAESQAAYKIEGSKQSAEEVVQKLGIGIYDPQG